MSGPSSLLLRDATLILPDRVVERGWLAAEDGIIRAFGDGPPPEKGGVDCGGDYVMPGLVELHTDHLEGHYAPRPKVRWHAVSSVLAYDAQIATAGITTVFDSLRVGTDSRAENEDLTVLAGALASAQEAGLLRADHRTHLRCEVSAGNVIEQAGAYLARYPAHLMSLMDHTPGQRQFTDLAVWRTYYTRKHSFTQAELDGFIAEKLDAHARHADANRRWLVDTARRDAIVVASHDDATAGHVDEAVADGVAIAEFPTTLEAASASHAVGLKVLMGAPNVIRGGSHSGNVAAEELARRGTLDILSSDYIPASLLMAAFDLPRRVPAITLPEAVRTVTLNPANATGLTDRGAIAAGRRADLVRLSLHDGVPVVRDVMRGGTRIA